MADQDQGAKQVYTLKSWAGFPLYQCNHCPFNSTNIDIIFEHFIGLHAPDPTPEPPSGLVLVADKRGEPVELPAIAETDELTVEDILALAKQPAKRRRR